MPFPCRYESLLPKMNQIVINSETQPLIESIKDILITVCSDSAFSEGKSEASQMVILEQLGFSALCDPTFGASTTDYMKNAKLASEIMERIIS